MPPIRTRKTQASKATKAAVRLGGLLVLVILLAASAGGCSSENGGGPLTTASGTSIGPTGGTGSSTTSSSDADLTSTTLPQVLTDWDRQLAETAQVQNRLAAYLSEQGTTQDDPRLAIIYGLRARVQAITARQALERVDLDLADSAMRDVYATINLGRSMAEGSISKTLEAAHSIIASLGIPSERPDEAAGLLDRFIAELAPLLDEARSLVPSG